MFGLHKKSFLLTQRMMTTLKSGFSMSLSGCKGRYLNLSHCHEHVKPQKEEPDFVKPNFEHIYFIISFFGTVLPKQNKACSSKIMLCVGTTQLSVPRSIPPNLVW